MKIEITFIALAMVVLSCQAPENKEATTEVTPTVATPDNNKVALAQQMFDAFNKHDWQAMANFYTDSALFLDPAFGKTYVKQARSQTVQKYTLLNNVFPDIHDEVVAMYPSGDKVIVEFVSTGTLASGELFQLPIITVLTFENNLIVKDATYYDVENSGDEETPEQF